MLKQKGHIFDRALSPTKHHQLKTSPPKAAWLRATGKNWLQSSPPSPAGPRSSSSPAVDCWALTVDLRWKRWGRVDAPVATCFAARQNQHLQGARFFAATQAAVGALHKRASAALQERAKKGTAWCPVTLGEEPRSRKAALPSAISRKSALSDFWHMAPCCFYFLTTTKKRMCN